MKKEEKKLDIKKLVKICKSLTKEERLALLKILQDGEIPQSSNYARRSFPQDATLYQYQGSWKDIY